MARDVELSVRPVRRAFQQVADQLRDVILSGRLTSGDRLPTESELCERFGVSRSTVREALRTLASEGLITTARGAGGGSFVALPHADNVVEFLTGTFSLMAGSREVSVLELLEARKLLEVPAAQQAAAHRDEAQLAGLHAAVPDHPHHGDPFEANQAFHAIVLTAAPNRLLRVMAQPLFATLQTRFVRERATPRFWAEVFADHRRIAAAVEARDAAEAGTAMAEHLENLRPTYEAIDAVVGAAHLPGQAVGDRSSGRLLDAAVSRAGAS